MVVFLSIGRGFFVFALSLMLSQTRNPKKFVRHAQNVFNYLSFLAFHYEGLIVKGSGVKKGEKREWGEGKMR